VKTVDGRAELTKALAQEMPWYISAAVRFQVAVAHQLDMPVTDVHALAAMLEAGPVGIGRLAELMGTTASAVTRLVDRLERGGYVRREPDPEDRRRVLVRVVPERVADIAPFYEPMDARWRRRIDGYSDAELRFLLDFLRQGRQDAEAETARLRAGGRAHGTRRRRAEP
jgi:DNA-binding MarR family transcriptional regulator